MAGTDDNILGGQDAVIRVGVEADMSEILQQATKFNELIKDANDSFNTMQTVITSTTTRMAALNSATLRLVSSARQLRGEYQLIAESSQRIGFLGGGESEEGPVGIGGKALGSLISGVGGPFREGSSGLIEPASMAGVSGAAEMPEPFPGLDKAIPGVAKEGAKAAGEYSSAAGSFTIGSKAFDDKEKPGRMLARMVEGGAAPSQMVKALIGRLIPSLGPTMAAIAPYALPTIGAAVAGYKALDYMIKGATRYTGLTGGTGVSTSFAEGDYNLGPFGINRGSFLGLQMAKWLPGLANMAVGPQGYGEIQEGLLTSGYKPYGDAQANALGMGGMRWDKTRATLAALYGKGYQDVGANIALMQTSLESARTSTASFTASMDQLRITAQKTNASMKGLTTAFTTMMKSLTGGMGATGNWTNLFSVAAATAYANANNAALRNGGAVTDISQFGAQVQLMNTPAFREANINFENRFMAYSTAPGMAQVLARGTDQAADMLLKYIGVGDVSNLNATTIENMLRNKSIEVDALRNSEMAKALVGPEVTGDVNAFIEYLVRNAKGDPNYKSTTNLIRQSGANPIKNFGSTANYFDSVLGGGLFNNQENLGRKRVQDFLQASPEDRSKYSVLSGYYNYVGRTHQGIGWLNSIIAADEQDQTWVKYRNKKMKLGKFMQDYGFNSPEATKLMESGELQVATSQNGKRPDGTAFSAAYNIQANEKTVQNMTMAELKDTFTDGMSAWVKQNNTLGDGKLKVSADGILGIG